MTHHTDIQATVTKGRWRRGLAMVLAVVVMPFAILLGVATPASAAPTGCPAGATCLASQLFGAYNDTFSSGYFDTSRP